MKTEQILKNVEMSIRSETERDYFLIHEERYKTILGHLSNLSHLGHLKILDVGCYPYHLGAAMERMECDVYGISSLHEPVHSKKIKICNIENDKFPFKDNFFDLVVFTEVLEHLPQSPLHALREMYRVTKPGGHLLVTTPNITRSINRLTLLFGRSIMYPLSQVLENNGKGSIIYHRHNREYTLAELTEIVRASNWNISTANYFISYTPTRRRATSDTLFLKIAKWANYVLMRLFPSLGDTLLVVGQK